MIPANLDVIRPTTEKAAARFDAAIEDLREGFAKGAIRKVTLDAAKSALGRAVDKAWDTHVQEPFFFAGRYQEQSEEVRDLYHSFMVSSLHDCISARKKIEKSGLEGPVIDAMNKVMAQAHPIAEVVRGLKDHVVKGRAPNPNPPPVNPDKEIGTCSCCFRGIAVTGGAGKMAHHGYQRPGTGEQTASCAGVDFKPLEVSVEGLEWMIDTTEKQRDKLHERLAKAPDLKELRWMERDRKAVSGFTSRHITSGDPNWPRMHARHIRDLETQLRGTESDLDLMAKELVKWQAFHGFTPEEPDESPSP